MKIAESHSGELWRGKWQGNDIVARLLAISEVTPRISRDFQAEFPALSSKHVVVDEDLSAKISMADTKFSFQEVGRLYSPAWMSPEALQHAPTNVNVRAADMWSFGILLWELSTREVPFSDLSPMEIGMKIALEGLRVPFPPGISRNMGRLMNICLNEDPGRRPNFDQIIPILEKMAQT
uniref:Protein kinase domain-containing protein n=1 Tax=Parascaris equorum TaxID=6256 RepID=A0A914S4I3_PAREQ